MKKMSKHIVLSFAVSSLLFSQAYALPQGGKFTHGTSGTIHTSGNTVTITGKGQNHVIQWGGGFNIGQNESVNFNGKNQNYLNIAYQKDASKIDGALNGGNNNIFLVNPMGVLIGKTGTITAGKFVASTTPLNDENVKTFLKQGASFSPAFDVSKQGNIINLGKINADNIVLIGNKVEIGVGAELAGQDGQTNAKTAHLIGNYVYVSVGKDKENKNTIKIDKDGFKGTAIVEGFMQRDMTSFAGDNYQFGDFGTILKSSYNGKESQNFYKAITIGGWENDKNIQEWILFSNGWNKDELNGIFKDDLTTVRLVSDIDFGYKNAVDPVGASKYAFSGIFDGGNYTLKNILINAQNTDKGWNTGIFGKVEGKDGNNKAKIYNLNVDGLKFSGKTNSGGAFVGQSSNADFSNIHLKNIGDLIFFDPNSKNETSGFLYGGGFVGYAKSGSSFNRISLDNFSKIALQPEGKFSSAYIDIYLGGFAGYSEGSNFSNILLNNIGGVTILGSETGGNIFAGGFVGYAGDKSYFSQIDLKNIGSVQADGKTFVKHAGAGGFAGAINGTNSFEKISLINFGDIIAKRGYVWVVNGNFKVGSGGFIGLLNPLDDKILYVDFKNVLLNFDQKMQIYAKAGDGASSYFPDLNNWEYNFSGGFFGGLFTSKVGRANFNNIQLKFGQDVSIIAQKFRSNPSEKYQGLFYGYSVKNWNDGIMKTDNVAIYYEKNYNTKQYNWYYQDIKDGFFGSAINGYAYKDGRSYEFYDYNIMKDREINKQIIAILEKDGVISKDYNNGYVSYYDGNAKITPEVPDFKDPVLSKDDFDPKLLQRILDDLMNGKYTYDFDTKTWTYVDSKGVVGKDEASEITQSLNFLNAFKDTKMEQEFVNLWKNSQDQNYKNYTNLYEKWTQKKTAMDKIKTGEGYFASFKEELQKYQEALAQLDKENKNYEKIKESGLVSDETLKVMYEKLLEQKEALEKQFADLSGNEGFHYKLENEILNSQGFSIEGKDVDDKAYTGNYKFEGKLASLPEKPNISIYEPDKQGGEDPDKPSVLPPEIPEKVVEAPIKIQTEVDTKKEEDDDQVEIGEADARSSGLRCIVSDNFKTMNICVNAK
ncbi:TPA: filamentous hemagglutinin N-terminal domain-containing protein [Campylobacter jejuni]|nr:filamentous hemagglutinin N-terminal domain-containing protein [Campylobacter jejuni]HEC2395710.1 filamentous hemagglutinin N-terminal domain-containing protein [Campylobacter jejuni]